MADYLPFRMRRLRSSMGMRRLVRNVSLTADNLVYPLFVRPGSGVKEPIGSMPGCFHFSSDTVVEEARQVAELGIPAVLLFGLCEEKDATGSQGWDDKGPLAQAVRNIKQHVPELLVITDVCLCEYTSHGHCGVVGDAGVIENDQTCQLLGRVALSHARAGADIVAPSDMMDHRVAHIRGMLDAEGFVGTAIMSYSAKYASAFYGPFRDAAESAPAFGDRNSYQMDPRSDQAQREIQLDIDEGADIVMIKPAMGYLDIIAHAARRFSVPVAAYQVSGEYMMINDAAEAGHLDRQQAIMESLYCIKRAGAQIIITYFAKEVAAWTGCHDEC